MTYNFELEKYGEFSADFGCVGVSGPVGGHVVNMGQDNPHQNFMAVH